MKKYLLAISLVIAATPAFAACNEQQMAEKAMLVTTKLEAIMAKDAKAGEALMTKMISIQSDPKALASIDAMCKSYDDVLAEIAKVK